MLKELFSELRKSSVSVLPIYALVIVLYFCGAVSLTGYEIFSFSIATVFIILGISLFNYGAEHAMTPIGKSIGKGLTRQGKTWVLFLVVFIFGVAITVAEPDLSVLALQTSSVFNSLILTIAVGVSVGFFLLLAVLKQIRKRSLIKILSVAYMFAFGLVALIAYQGKENMVALCFDSGGVTTGPMTVPFIMALGAGIAAVVAQKSERDASFGFIALASVGPVIIVLILTLFSSNKINYKLADYSLSDNFFLSYGHYLLEKLKDVGICIGILYACYLLIELAFLHSGKDKILRMTGGLSFAFFGLVIFLAAVDCTYMGVGFKLGKNLGGISPAITIIIAFAIGALTVLAEPAIKILITQVEELTNGLIKRKSMLVALAIGVGVAIMLAMIRILFKFSLLYIILPGYLLCFILSFFVPKIYVAIAFDSGGVASGPLTSSFILPIALGLCAAVNGVDQILNFGFGIVSLVALSPLLSIEILGVISLFNNKRRAKKEIKRVLKEDDNIIISFGD